MDGWWIQITHGHAKRQLGRSIRTGIGTVAASLGFYLILPIVDGEHQSVLLKVISLTLYCQQSIELLPRQAESACPDAVRR